MSTSVDQFLFNLPSRSDIESGITEAKNAATALRAEAKQKDKTVSALKRLLTLSATVDTGKPKRKRRTAAQMAEAQAEQPVPENATESVNESVEAVFA